MKFRTLNLVGMLLSEAIAPRMLKRAPEPDVVMDDPENVRAFHDQGDAGGHLLPVYHFNAVATSRLLPHGGTLLDLGSGSGQYLMYLARCREDIRILGLDLSGEMVSLGNRLIKEFGMEQRMKLMVGDMRDFSGSIHDHIDVISSIFAFHHLPGLDELRRCLNEIGVLCDRFGCAVWTFDHARPRLRRTAKIFPEIFTGDAPEFFRQDSTNSLIASFSFSELSENFESCLRRPVSHCCSKFMRLYQIHWVARDKSGLSDAGEEVAEDFLTPDARKEYKSLRWLFSGDRLVKG